MKNTEKICYTAEIPKHVDEFLFIDSDIKDVFKGTQYIIGLPTQIQLNRNIGKLLEKLKEYDKLHK